MSHVHLKDNPLLKFSSKNNSRSLKVDDIDGSHEKGHAIEEAFADNMTEEDNEKKIENSASCYQ